MEITGPDWFWPAPQLNFLNADFLLDNQLKECWQSEFTRSNCWRTSRIRYQSTGKATLFGGVACNLVIVSFLQVFDRKLSTAKITGCQP